MKIFNYIKSIFKPEKQNIKIIFLFKRIDGSSLRYASVIDYNRIYWDDNIENAIKFDKIEDVEEIIKKDKYLRHLVRSCEFFVEREKYGIRTPIKIPMDDFHNEMLKHTFKSKPIMKDDPNYITLKNRLYDLERSKRVSAEANVGLVKSEDVSTKELILKFQTSNQFEVDIANINLPDVEIEPVPTYDRGILSL